LLVAENKINVIFMTFHRYFLVPHTLVTSLLSAPFWHSAM